MLDHDKQIQDELKSKTNLPAHIAIIMDGNGRWAKDRGLPRVAGHFEGINSVREIVEVCGELGIKILTLYTFSSENWNRPPKEVSALMKLLIKTLRKEVNKLNKKNVQLVTIGNLEDLPLDARKELEDAKNLLSKNTGLVLNLALSYSSRKEILNGVVQIITDIQCGNVNLADLDENLFSKYLYTNSLPDPDLLIRTSGELRISNFLLWQLAYTELYITNIHWPSFRKSELYDAIRDYQGRERRFGRVSEQLNQNV